MAQQIVLGICVFGMAVCSLARASNAQHEPELPAEAEQPPPQEWVAGLKRIPRRRVMTDAPFAELCAEQAIPVVLEGSVTTTWRAASEWTPAKLRERMRPTLHGVYTHTSPSFGPYMDLSRPLGADGSVTAADHPNPYISDATVDVKQFWDHLNDPGQPPGVGGAHGAGVERRYYHYYSGEIDQFDGGEGWALHDIDPIDELIALMPSRSSINVWIGQRGASAHAHYDGYHNFYASLTTLPHTPTLPRLCSRALMG